MTIIRNAAIEPEITDLVMLLNKMGAKISGIGTSTLVVEGVSELHGANHTVIFDRIEAGMYATAAVITEGEIILENVDYDIFCNISRVIAEIGADITKCDGDKIKVTAGGARRSVDITTGPYPCFPTDMQAQLMALLAISSGDSVISENIFENRYMHVPELIRMGANITIKGGVATIHGVESFHGAEVMATDLRASGSLVLAGLVATGETIINRVYHLDRGYEKLEDKLARCGAKIYRVV